MTPEEFVEAVRDVTRVTLLNVEPGATVVLEVERSISAEEGERISQAAKDLFAPHKVAVLSGGIRVAGARIEVAS